LAVPAFFMAAANASPATATLTLAQALVAFPQYSSVADTWGTNVGNFNYNSLQLTLLQRMAHGLSFNINYTYSKNLGDDGTFRSGFNIPGAAISNGAGGASSQSWKQDRIDRSWTTVSAPESFHAFGVYQLPFGKGHMGGDSFLVRSLAGGWQVSGIYQYAAGTPIAVTSSVCSGTTYPGQGQCMPDLNPGSADFTSHSARINGSYGTGAGGRTACNLGIGSGCVAIPYIDKGAFANPTNVSTAPTPASLAQYLIGDAPRTQALNLRNPGTQDLDASLRRSFALPRDIGNLVIEADCLNVWNKVTMSGPSGSWSPTSATFGTITSIATTYQPRDWQFAGHFNF